MLLSKIALFPSCKMRIPSHRTNVFVSMVLPLTTVQLSYGLLFPVSSNADAVQFYASTFPSKDVRDASSAVARLFANSDIELYSRQDMFSRVNAVLKQENEGSDSKLDSESLHCLQKLHRRFQQNGCSVSDERQRNEFKVKMMRLADLVRECNKNQ